jgi:antitoxin component of MazEF toxin-antitoxin module
MEQTKILKMGGSLCFRIPYQYRETYGLKHGDSFVWRDDGAGYFTLKAVRKKDVQAIFSNKRKGDDDEAQGPEEKTHSSV